MSGRDLRPDDDKGHEQMAPGDEAPPGEPAAGPTQCQVCGGSGRREGSACEACGGTGYTEEAVGGG